MARIKFLNQITGDAISSVNWNFGDGSSSTELDPLHNFLYGVDYTVGLQAQSVSGLSGSASAVVSLPVAVAVGGQGRIYSTFDASGWFLRESDTTEILYSVAFNDGTWVASGANALLLKSGDGIEWDKTTISVPAGEWPSLYKIMYVHDQFFILGQNFILSSPNSIDWTSRYIGVTNTELVDLAYGDGTYVAITYNPAIFYPTLVVSTDSTNWTVYDQTNLPFNYYAAGITFSDHTWYFAIQSNPAMAYCAISTDLTSWALSDLKSNYLPTSITKLDGTFFVTSVIGFPGTALNSVDATNWSSVALPSWEGTNWVTYSQKYGKFLIGAGDGAIFDSTNGVNWHETRVWPYENVVGIATIDEPLE